MLREVQRYTPPDPADVGRRRTITAVRRPILRRPGCSAGCSTAAGLSGASFRSWLRDDLRIAAYLDQRFAAAESPERRADSDTDWTNSEREVDSVADRDGFASGWAERRAQLS